MKRTATSYLSATPPSRLSGLKLLLLVTLTCGLFIPAARALVGSVPVTPKSLQSQPGGVIISVETTVAKDGSRHFRIICRPNSNTNTFSALSLSGTTPGPVASSGAMTTEIKPPSVSLNIFQDGKPANVPLLTESCPDDPTHKEKFLCIYEFTVPAAALSAPAVVATGNYINPAGTFTITVLPDASNLVSMFRADYFGMGSGTSYYLKLKDFAEAGQYAIGSGAAILPPPPAKPTPANAADPRLDLKTAVPDLLRLVQAGDFAALAAAYMTPQAYARHFTELSAGNRTALLAMGKDPVIVDGLAAFAKALETIKEAAPVYNSTNDRATFKIQAPSVGGAQAAWSSWATDGIFALPLSPGIMGDLIFVKIDGLWYLKPVE